MAVQRWFPHPAGPGRSRAIARAGHPTSIPTVDLISRCTHRLLVLRAAAFKQSSPTRPACPPPSHLPGRILKSVYMDASWREAKPISSSWSTRMTFRSGTLFLSANSPDWCSQITAISFEIPLTLRALGGSAQVAELLAIQTGLHLLHTLHVRGIVHTDCLSAVKKITRRWSPGRSFQGAGAALVASCRGLSIRLDLHQMAQRPSGALRTPPLHRDPPTVGHLPGGLPYQESGHRLTSSFSDLPTSHANRRSP